MFASLGWALPAAAARSCPFDGSDEPIAAAADPSRPVRFLTDVRAGHHRCFDRVVFEFDRPSSQPPGFDVRYEPPPIREDGSSREVPVDGDSFVVVRLTPSRDTRVSGGQRTPTYRGPKQVEVPGGTRIVDLRHVSSFEGTVKWAIGVDTRRPFRVTSLTSPPRVVVDVG